MSTDASRHVFRGYYAPPRSFFEHSSMRIGYLVKERQWKVSYFFAK